MPNTLFRFHGNVGMRGLGKLIYGNLYKDASDYGSIAVASTPWPGALMTPTDTASRTAVKGLQVDEDKTWIEDLDMGEGAYGLNAAKPSTTFDYGSVA